MLFDLEALSTGLSDIKQSASGSNCFELVILFARSLEKLLRPSGNIHGSNTSAGSSLARKAGASHEENILNQLSEAFFSDFCSPAAFGFDTHENLHLLGRPIQGSLSGEQ